MKRIAIALVIVTMSASAGFAGTRVRFGFDENRSFAGLKTYQWLKSTEGEVETSPFVSPLLEIRIQEAVNRELQAKGFQMTADGLPDVQIVYHVVTKQDVDASPIGRSYGSGYYHYRPSGHRGYGYSGHHGHRGYGYSGHSGYGGYGYPYSGYVEQYLSVTLVLDIYDAKTGELIWSGRASRKLARNPNARDVKKFADKGVRKLLKQFPPEGPLG